MNHFRNLSDSELAYKTQSLVAEERRMTTEILWLLREVERRRLFAQKGYGSLFDYAVKDLGYSDSAAMRRINAMRLLRELPDVASSLENGSLSLSVVSAAQNFFKREKKENGKTYSVQEKREILGRMENQSRRDCDKILATLSPNSVLPPERERVVSETKIELRFVVDQELVEKLNRIRGLIDHQKVGASYAELLEYMAELTLEKVDPLKRVERSEARKKNRNGKVGYVGDISQAGNSEQAGNRDEVEGKGQGAAVFTRDTSEDESRKVTSPAKLGVKVPKKFPVESGNGSVEITEDLFRSGSVEVPGELAGGNSSVREYISAPVRRQIWLRDQGKCTYCDPQSGRRCQSTYGIQIDHIQPISQNGNSDVTNLRLLCAVHNRWEAIRKLGSQTMAPYLKMG